MRTSFKIWIGLWAFVCVLSPLSISAQGLNLTSADQGEPLSIDARGGVEWSQDTKVFIAKGPKATATQGEMTVEADELRAYYREVGSKTEIFRLDALSNVRITSPGRIATGNHAVYDVDKQVVVLKDGDPVKLVSGADVIIANSQIEFWETRQLAVARGGAQVARAGKRMRADVLTAHFEKDAAGKTQVQLIEAFDNVRIDTEQEQVFSDRAAYNVPTGLARLTGSVRIVRGQNQLNGCSADIDLNTGISRLNSCEDGGVRGTTGAGTPTTNSAGRVHGVLKPNAVKK